MLLRNCQWFCTKDTKLLKFSTRCTKLPEGFVVKLRNSLQFSELKKVLYENYETFFMLRNLKSFRKTVLNLQSSVEHLLFFRVHNIIKYILALFFICLDLDNELFVCVSLILHHNLFNRNQIKFAVAFHQETSTFNLLEKFRKK